MRAFTQTSYPWLYQPAALDGNTVNNWMAQQAKLQDRHKRGKLRVQMNAPSAGDGQSILMHWVILENDKSDISSVSPPTLHSLPWILRTEEFNTMNKIIWIKRLQKLHVAIIDKTDIFCVIYYWGIKQEQEYPVFFSFLFFFDNNHLEVS